MTAVRVYTTRTRRPKTKQMQRRRTKRRPPFEVLVFDTETINEPAQNLLLLVWRFYRDDPDEREGKTCVEVGIAYPDHLPDTDPEAFQILVDYVETHSAETAAGFGKRILLWSESKWLRERLYQYGYRHRDRCSVVGFNLPFDFGRLARHWSPGRGQFRGGWSLGSWGSWVSVRRWKGHPFRPRLRFKAIDSKRTLFSWGGTKDPDDRLPGERGRFVDLRTLAFALTDRSHSLESACRAFGVAFTKDEVEYGVISPQLVAYALDDVAATGWLYRALLDELEEHEGIDLVPRRLYSPATVGVQYLKAMGIEEPMTKFDLPDETHGYAMSGFYGGRAEARIVRTPVLVAYVDATSMYPTVNALLGTWDLLTAADLEQADATDRVRRLLADPDDLYRQCFDPEFWRKGIGVTLVEVDHPDGALLPVRGEYDELSDGYGIGLNPTRYDGTLWYMLPDVINATIQDQQPVPIRRAIRILPVDIQDGLRPVKLRGGKTIDPRSEDLFTAFIEHRHQTKQNQDLPAETRQRLDLFLKITANATGYGALARFDRRNLSQPVEATVHGPDDPFTIETTTPEDPGPYTLPPIAASITAGGHLMLGLLERAVTDAGGSYAFCDTDSMGIVTSLDPTPLPCETADGTNTINPLSPNDVRRLLELFEALNPYDSELIPHLWTEEHDSINNPLWCYAISTKRYVLYRLGDDGRPEVVDWSEHGLGQYLDPIDKRDDQGRRVWVKQAWEWILNGNGVREAMPPWADLPAVSRFSLTTPAVATWFTGYDRRQPRHKRIRPSSFGLIAHPDLLLGKADGRQPTALYNTNSDQWLDLDWYDRNTGEPIDVTTASPGDPQLYEHLAEGRVMIRTLGDVLAEFRMRPEHKSLAPDGSPATGRTKGQLRRRPIEGAPVLTDLIGKEGNNLEERTLGIGNNAADHRNQYGNRGNRWTQLVLPVLQELGAEEIMKRTGREKSAVYEVLTGKEIKYRGPAVRYRDVAVDEARRRLTSAGERVPRNPFGVLYRAVWRNSPNYSLGYRRDHDSDWHDGWSDTQR